MKLIRIGSSNKCDIVLHSQFVSAHHAEITVLNNGELLLEDKGSTNGTFIGDHRVTPNKENKIMYGDKIRFADQLLDWRLVPQKENVSDCTVVVNIGSHHRNDIVLTGDPYASRYHAMFYVRGGKSYIRDCGSVNSTMVNGVKLGKNKETAIKRGDVVVCGQSDITADLAQYMPGGGNWLKWSAIGVAAAAVLAGVVYAVLTFLCGKIAPEEMKPAVVYVQTYYHYKVKFEDNPIPEYWNGEIDLADHVSPYFKERGLNVDNIVLKGGQATAFFIDRNGHLGTNRHVAIPWEYNKDKDYEIVKRVVELYLSSMFPSEIKTQKDYNKLLGAVIGDDRVGVMFKTAVENSNRNEDAVKLLDSFVKRLHASKFTLIGKMDHILVGFPGRNYTHMDEFQRCSVVAVSDEEKKDVAILEMNDKRTPEMEYVFDVEKFSDKQLVPLKETFNTIGYPHGIVWAMDEDKHSLEPAIRETKCAKTPSVYDFEFDGEAIGGASGSPIFTDKGELVGVVWGGWSAGKTYGLACQAKWLKKLYEEEVLGK